MKRYGLLGRSLRHSWSKQWFDQLFAQRGIADAEYRLYEVAEASALPDWHTTTRLDGYNVTLPYKEAILSCLDGCDTVASSIGAVNCVAREGYRWIGHNTDAPAFRQTLQPLLCPWHTAALVLGTGGAARAVSYALRALGIDHRLVSRHPNLHPNAIGYEEAVQLASSHLLIINATPVGMAHITKGNPWPCPAALGTKHLCYDLIYNPSPTLFLQQAARQGATTKDGLDMLHLQAALSWQVWASVS